jgi:hypothetical protein
VAALAGPAGFDLVTPTGRVPVVGVSAEVPIGEASAGVLLVGRAGTFVALSGGDGPEAVAWAGSCVCTAGEVSPRTGVGLGAVFGRPLVGPVVGLVGAPGFPAVPARPGCTALPDGGAGRSGWLIVLLPVVGAATTAARGARAGALPLARLSGTETPLVGPVGRVARQRPSGVLVSLVTQRPSAVLPRLTAPERRWGEGRIELACSRRALSRLATERTRAGPIPFACRMLR